MSYCDEVYMCTYKGSFIVLVTEQLSVAVIDVVLLILLYYLLPWCHMLKVSQSRTYWITVVNFFCMPHALSVTQPTVSKH